MYKIISAKNNKLKLKDIDKKSNIILSSNEEICNFLINNNIRQANFYNDLLSHIHTQDFYTLFCQIVLPKLKRPSMINPLLLYKLIKNNLHQIDEETFNNFRYIIPIKSRIELYNQYKDSDSISLSILTGLAISTFNDGIFIDFLTNHSQNLDIDTQIDILKMIRNDELKLNYLLNNQNLDIEHQVKIVKSFKNNQLKLDFINDKTDLDFNHKIDIMRSLKDCDKLKFDFLNKYNNTSELDMDNHTYLLCSISNDEQKLNYLIRNQNSFDLESRDHILQGIKNREMLFKFLLKNKDFIDMESQVFIVSKKIHNLKLKFEFLDSTPNLDEIYTTEILKSVLSLAANGYPNHSKIAKLYKSNKYDIQRLVPLEKAIQIGFFSQKEVLQFISKNLTDFSITRLNNLDNINFRIKLDGSIIVKSFTKNINRLDSEQLFYLICNSSPHKQKAYYKKFKDRLNETQRFLILNIFKKSNLNCFF